jgi:MoxR-like ATPase
MPETTSASTPATAAEIKAKCEQFRQMFLDLKAEIGKVIVGHTQTIDGVLIALFAGGNVLLEGVPGLGKTLLVRTLAEALSLPFSRIQFTPDLMPADVIGTNLVSEDPATGRRAFQFQKGPIFAQLVLADEINRATPKTQSALLEAMQERSVTVAGHSYKLDLPFLVLATQNPIEQEGTYPLPEAQLDRFMFEIKIGYPSEAEELSIVQRTTGGVREEAGPVLGAADIQRVQELVRAMPIAEHVLAYALRIVRGTRVGQRGGEIGQSAARGKMVEQYVSWGAGPRASEYLVLAAKARALLSGSTHTTPEHVREVAKPVLRHRLMLNFNAEADQVPADAIIDALLKETPVDGLSEADKKLAAGVLRA